jgi:hypothetical protein
MRDNPDESCPNESCSNTASHERKLSVGLWVSSIIFPVVDSRVALTGGPQGKIRFRSRESAAMTWQQDGGGVHPVAADKTLSLPWLFLGISAAC